MRTLSKSQFSTTATRWGRAFIAALLSVASASAIHAEVKVVAEYVPFVPRFSGGSIFSIPSFGVGVDGDRVFDNKILQTFTVAQSGEVDYVMLRMAGDSQDEVNPRVRIVKFNESSGQVEEVLGEAFINSEEIPAFSLAAQTSRLTVFADFTDSAVTLVAGSDYAILLDTAEARANHRIERYPFSAGVGPNGTHNLWKSQNSPIFRQERGSLIFQIVEVTESELEIVDFDYSFFYSPPDNFSRQTTFSHRLRWSAELGKTYQVMQTNDFINWSRVGNTSIAATVPVMTLDWNRTVPRFSNERDFFRYFRVEEVTP